MKLLARKHCLMAKGSVLMVVSTYVPLAGHGTVINNLSDRLSKMGYNIAIGAFSFEQEPPNNVQKVILNKFGRLTSNIRGQDFDIIHNYHTKMNYYSLLTSKPFIFHYHGTSNRLQEINLKLSMVLCKNRISKIITPSYSSLNQFRSIAGDISSDVIYNGVDTEWYHPGLSRPFRKGEPQLLFVGSLQKYKNISTLISIMTKIKKYYPDAHLQIVGAGNEYTHLAFEIKRSGLENNIELLGKLQGEKLRLTYSSCDIYISASRIEAYPLPPVEAMACGKPLFLSDIPIHKELLKASNAGLAFSLNEDLTIPDKIMQIYNNRKNLSIAAREFSEKYDWPAMSDRIAHIYDRLLR